MKSLYVATLLLITIFTTSCSTLFTYPDELSQKERFGFFQKNKAQLKQKIRIYWDEHSIPFIEAQNDEDLAFAVGLIHAHLRIDQMELMRYLSQGRLSELAGPIPQIKQLDKALRILNFEKAARNSLQAMSKESLAWMRNFTRGVNWYIAQLNREPVVNRFTDQKLKPYSELEMITLSRVVSSDLTWAMYLKFLKYAENAKKDEWKQVFNFSLRKLKTDSASYDNPENYRLINFIKGLSRSGSNSVVVGGKKTKSGSAMIASDPHVGIMLPNFWLLIGIKSPRYHAIGYMMPGVPIFGIGRNENIAWGGTNMRAISSHLYDVSNLKEKDIRIRKEKIKRRWWFSTTVKIRETKLGPVFSDIDFFDHEKMPLKVALNWVGWQGSDEIESFLKIARARNWREFKNAFASYRVSAMNMLYADSKGNIGMVAAYGQPVLKKQDKTLDFIKTEDNPVIGVIPPTRHPNPYNPSRGFIASANNKPFASPLIPFSFSYANSDRYDRMRNLVGGRKKIQLQDLKNLQTDIFSRKAFDLKEQFVKASQDFDFKDEKKLFKEFRDWDGKYLANSRKALLFEVSMNFIWQEYIKSVSNSELLRKELSAYENWKQLMSNWIKKRKKIETFNLLKMGLKKSRPLLEKFHNWGEFTVMRQSTPLGMIPVIGSRFRKTDYPVNGNSDTLNKYGRKFNLEKAEVVYGASARHISDLSSPDENYFVMHGGQDSWIFNENIDDQTRLWRKGKYIKIPLTMEKVKKQFNSYLLEIKPE